MFLLFPSGRALTSSKAWDAFWSPDTQCHGVLPGQGIALVCAGKRKGFWGKDGPRPVQTGPTGQGPA